MSWDQIARLKRQGDVRQLLASLLGLVLLVSACSSTPVETGSGAPEPTTTTAQVPPVATTGPTPLAIPTTAATSAAAADEPTVVQQDGTPVPTASAANPTATAQPTATAVPSATAAPTATVQPAATVTPRPIPTAAPTAIVVSPTPTPIPTATPRPVTPTPTSVWVNPDCYVGPGAADEPVWWCGGRICVVGAPHHGCPRIQPTRPAVFIDCSVSDRDLVVNEITTFTAVYEPANAAVRFAFAHGDGTIDNVSVSRAYYEAPGTYRVTLLYQYAGGKGTVPCGHVTVRGTASPTPTPLPTATPAAVVQIGCSITPSRTVRVNDILTFTAFQSPTNVAVAYVFDHGDGTLDETAQSRAYYAAPGYYDVRLNWAYNGQSGTTFCGTVTVEPNFNAGDYLGRTPESAEALATSRGFETRIVRIDDQYFPGTTDYRLDRINLEIDGNKVTKASIG